LEREVREIILTGSRWHNDKGSLSGRIVGV